MRRYVRCLRHDVDRSTSRSCQSAPRLNDPAPYVHAGPDHCASTEWKLHNVKNHRRMSLWFGPLDI